MTVFAGLWQMSCDMCGDLVKPDYLVRHKDGTTAKICAVCYGKCLCYDKFSTGIEQAEITIHKL